MTKKPDTTPADVREALQDTGYMNCLMDGLFGKGGWVFDEAEDVWVAPNDKGPGFVIMSRGGARD